MDASVRLSAVRIRNEFESSGAFSPKKSLLGMKEISRLSSSQVSFRRSLSVDSGERSQLLVVGLSNGSGATVVMDCSSLKTVKTVTVYSPRSPPVCNKGFFFSQVADSVADWGWPTGDCDK